MSFTIDQTNALEAYVKGNAKQIAVKAIASAKTAKLLMDNKAVQPGIKGSAEILKMDSDVVFQDGSACGRTANGGTTFSGRMLTVKPIKDVQNICLKTLYNTRLVELIAQGQDPANEVADNAFIQSLMDERAAKVAVGIENLLWKGNTAGSGNLRFINGLSTQLKASGSGANSVTVTGTDVIAKLQSLYTQVDVTVRSQEDFRIFIGQDTYDALQLAKFNKNYFAPGSENVVPGTSAKLEVVTGLNGTNEAYALRISNLQLGMDGTDDADKAIFRYSDESQQFYMDFHFAVGIAVVFPDQTYYAAI